MVSDQTKDNERVVPRTVVKARNMEEQAERPRIDCDRYLYPVTHLFYYSKEMFVLCTRYYQNE